MADDWEIDGTVFDNVMALITASINDMDIGPMLKDAIETQEMAVMSLAVMSSIIQLLISNMIDEDEDQTVQTMWARIASHVAASRQGMVPPED